MLRKRTWILLLIALGLRLLLLGWDAGGVSSSIHPDERQVGYVTEKVEGWFADPGFFAYGSLHFQAVRSAASVLAMDDGVRRLVVGGRLLSVAASMLAILLGFAMAHRAWGRRTGELFLVLVAWIPLDLQQSHFATVEAHHAAWVMLALAACYWLATGGREMAAAAAGAAVGASLAVKVASLGLVFPLALALLLTLRQRDVLYLCRLITVAVGTGAFAFWLCQPWAFVEGRPPLALFAAVAVTGAALHLVGRTTGWARRALFGIALIGAVLAATQIAALAGLMEGAGGGRIIASTLLGAGLNPEYLRGVGEQVAMVMGRADLAYVRVYVDTLPILYPLRELALWGLGPLMLLAMIAGAAVGAWKLSTRWRRWLTGRWTNSSVLLLILLAWLIPMAFRLSTLYVKFLRYWEPLVVPAVMVAVWWLARLPKRYRRPAIRTVAAGTIVWGLAYVWAFVDPHPHLTASEWLQPMLSPDQVVAFESWDETIGLAPEDGAIERIDLPSYDLPDDREKIERWCQQLERADWVVLTSNRVIRTVLENDRRFPHTARLYRLLLAGEAGFEPATRVSRGPRIFGLRWPVQLADESFVNYEFPQVLILRRTSDIAPTDLAERVERPLPFLDELDFAGLEKNFIDDMPVLAPVPSRIRQVLDVTIWLVVFSGLGIAFWGLLLPVVRGWPDAGVGLALVTGWIVPAWLMWMGSEVGIWTTSPTTASWIYLGLVTAGAVAIRWRWHEVRAMFRRRYPAILKVLVITAVVALLFLVVRAFNPAIHWGEKPMDFSFLNAFVHAPQWPTGEPWMAGMPLHYYYFGQVLAAFPILVAGCSPAVGYNLMSATIPALSAAILASLGLFIARRQGWGAAWLPVVLVVLTGNLAWPWLAGAADRGNLFDMWWATSRVIPGFAIDEYPLWTTLFADLHGHFIALPVMLAALLWGWICVQAGGRRWIAAAVLCGVSTAVLVATNPWDLVILSTALGVGVLAAARRPVIGIVRLAAAAAVSLLAAAPFVVELVAGISAGAGERGLFLTDADFAPAWAILRHFGLFLIPLGALALVSLGRRSWIVLPTVTIGIVAGLSFGSSAAALGLAAAAIFATVALRTPDRLSRLAWSLATMGAMAVASAERFTLIDRMNTLFKVYNGVWVLLAVALAILLLRTRGGRRRLVVAVWLPLQLVAMVNLPLGIAQGWLWPRIGSPRPTLDGQAFLASTDPQTWFLVRALQGVASPGETIAEAVGNSYSRFTRITMHTGQPTVVGWDWHLKQRGQSPEEIAARVADLETLYAGIDSSARRAVLDRFRVGWIVLADVERERYGLDAANPLLGLPGVSIFAENHGSILYRVGDDDRQGDTAIAPEFESPAGTRLIGQIPEVSDNLIRSIAVDDFGASVVLRDGSLIELDSEVNPAGDLPSPGCNVSSLARRGEERWVACHNGTVWIFTGEQWRNAGRVRNIDFVTADYAVWVGGGDGLWRREGEVWRQIADVSVTAAAAIGPTVAWSDGSQVWVGDGSSRRLVGRPLAGVRALTWRRPDLWALGSEGLFRSGGAVLPWRRVMDDAGSLATVAGNKHGLWLVQTDGSVLELPAPKCRSPWTKEAPPTDAGLNEPRGLAVSPSGWFVVADTFNHRLRWYTMRGTCLDTFGVLGAAPGAFREPSGIALAEDGRLAVADTWNGRVQLIDPDGVAQVVDDGLFGPRDLLWEADGSLLVADTGNRKILRYSPPGWQRETVVELPAPVVGLARAGGLVAAAVPSDGAIFLVDPDSGETVRQLEVPGWNIGKQQEGYLALLPSGELAASAPFPGELWIVDPSGNSPPRLLRSGLPGLTAITLLPDGNLLGSLTWDHQLVKVSLEN